jgi:hypothetical protein
MKEKSGPFSASGVLERKSEKYNQIEISLLYEFCVS